MTTTYKSGVWSELQRVPKESSLLGGRRNSPRISNMCGTLAHRTRCKSALRKRVGSAFIPRCGASRYRRTRAKLPSSTRNHCSCFITTRGPTEASVVNGELERMCARLVESCSVSGNGVGVHLHRTCMMNTRGDVLPHARCEDVGWCSCVSSERQNVDCRHAALRRRAHRSMRKGLTVFSFRRRHMSLVPRRPEGFRLQKYDSL